MEQTKTILSEDKPIIYYPSDKEKKVVEKVFSLFTNTRLARDRSFEYFENQTLVDYINGSVRRWFTNIDERDGIEDWQARMFSPFTRDKVIAILGKVSTALPVPEFIAVGDEDIRRAQILGDLVDYTLRVDNDEELMFFSLLEAIVKGTVVGYEGYEERKKNIRDVSDYDSGDEIKLKENTIVKKKLFGSVIPLEDFYPSSVAIRKIQDMPFCFWRSVIPYSQFEMLFSQYGKSSDVQAKYSVAEKDGVEIPYYLDFISDDVNEGQVEILRYYNQDQDEFIILANGVWLNPLKNDEVMPIPFAHKKLPFWKAIYEPFGADFFYGKSLPSKLSGMQDVLNILNNMLLDQSFLTTFSPMLVGGTDTIDDDVLVPGRRIPVDDVNNYKMLDMQTPNGFHEFILRYTQQTLEESSLDKVQQGMVGGGDRVTAREINEAAQGVAAILGLFINFVKWAVKDKTVLRASNVLQFFDGIMEDQVLGENGVEEMNKEFKTIKIDDAVLTSGKRGMKIIQLYKNEKGMPNQVAMDVGATVLSANIGKRVEKIAISNDYIRDFRYDIKIIPNPKLGQSKALDRAMFMEYGNWVMKNFPDIVDRETLFAEGTEKFGYNPDKFMIQAQPKPINPSVQGEQIGGAGNTGTTQNLVNSAKGGSQSLSSMLRQQ